MMSLVQLALYTALAAAPAVAPELADDAKRMEGKWEVAVMEVRGEKPPAGGSKMAFTIEGGVMKGGGSTVKLKLDGDKDPKQIDFVEEGKPHGQIGIFKFEGEKLYFCFDGEGKARPTKFEAPAGTSNVLMVLERPAAK